MRNGPEFGRMQATYRGRLGNLVVHLLHHDVQFGESDVVGHRGRPDGH